MIIPMEKPEFFVSRDKLEYNISGQKVLDFSEEEYGANEVASVFYLNLRYEDEIYLPVAIFQNKITPLQVIVKYFKENLKLTNKKIALLLNRDPRAIWAAYKSVEKKKKLSFQESALQIPVGIFADRRFSILESLVKFLKDTEMKYSEIALLLDKDQRTIWTVYSRVRKKLGKNESKK